METPDIILIVLVSIIIVIQLVVLLRKPTNNNDNSDLINQIQKDNADSFYKVVETMGDMRVKITESIGKGAKDNIDDLNKFKESLKQDIDTQFIKMNKRIEEQMDNINKKVEFRLNEGFEKTNKTFTNIVERLTKIDEAQKNIEKLSTEVVSLQDLLSDKKSRGTFGEVQLNQILSAIFGEKNDKVYGTQVTLSNGTRVDALLYLTKELGNLPIDSKFPLENYNKMVDKNRTERERELATRAFKADMKKHIDAIASKYIVPDETSDQAVLFVPAEAIFAEINAYHQDVVEYSQGKRVWIASPTTLMSMLTTVQVILRNVERDKNAKIIQQELIALGKEFSRYQDRWDKLSRNIETVNKSVKDIHVTSGKIGKKFEQISHVELELEEPEEEDS